MFFLGERERGAKHFQNENQLAINISMYSNPTREIYLAGETAKKKKKGNHEMASRRGGSRTRKFPCFFAAPPQTKTSDEDDRRDEGRRLEAS